MQGTEGGTWAKREKDLHHPHSGPPGGRETQGTPTRSWLTVKLREDRVIHYNDFNLTLNVTST